PYSVLVRLFFMYSYGAHRDLHSFPTRRSSDLSDLRDAVPEAIEGKKIAVVARTAHEQYLKAFFTEAELKPFPNMEAARDALRKGDRKSTRLNSSHSQISYAVFCLKKKTLHFTT